MPPAAKPDPTGPSRTGKSASFEEALQKLEEMVLRLEDGQLGLEDSLAAYEKGVRYLQQCYRLLEKAEQRIRLLQRIDADGQATTEPFEEMEAGESEPSLEKRAQLRSRRRSRPGGEPGTAAGGPMPEMDGPGQLF